MTVKYDRATKAWLNSHIGQQTTVCKCEKCGLFYKPILGHKCKKEWGRMTNADRIRNMSNYELAEFIYNVSNGATKISTCEEKCAECKYSDVLHITDWRVVDWSK